MPSPSATKDHDMDDNEELGRLTPLSRKLKEFSLHIPENTTWGDDASMYGSGKLKYSSAGHPTPPVDKGKEPELDAFREFPFHATDASKVRRNGSHEMPLNWGRTRLTRRMNGSSLHIPGNNIQRGIAAGSVENGDLRTQYQQQKEQWTPLTSKLKEFSLNIEQDSSWADDANAEYQGAAEEHSQFPFPITSHDSASASTSKKREDYHDDNLNVPMSAMRLSTSRKRSRRVLETPTPDDQLHVVAYKMREIALAVQAGENAALITDLGFDIPHIRDPTEHAKQSMKINEREQYEAWEAAKTQVVDMNEFKDPNPNNTPPGESETSSTAYPPPRKQFTLPALNWETDTAPIPNGKYSLSRFKKRASALATAYSLPPSTPPLCTPEHASYFTTHHRNYLPLLSALQKVSRARRDLTGDAQTLSSLDVAEVGVLRAVNRVASKRVQEVYGEVRELVSGVERAKRVLREREAEIRAGVEGGVGRKRKDYGGVEGVRMR
ncbi:hypothetical protein FQN54_004221 [Arachnomyces sp. PD_36]|nr:hypothetical protein FQN54_004221 [Arachnomyces sp. PD_36]